MSSPETVQEFQRLVAEKEKHRGYTIIRELERLATSYYIVFKNYDEMIDKIRKIEDDYQILAPRNFQQFRRVLREITRQLHNYLASIQSLIDHTCTFRDKYGNDNVIEECKDRLAILTENNCTSFVKLFRNYIQHVELPIIGAHVRFHRESIEDEMKREPVKISLNKARLLIWPRWNKKARNYITDFQGDFEIIKIFEEYNALNKEYNNWFHHRIRALYEADLNDLLNLDGKIRTLGKELGIIE